MNRSLSLVSLRGLVLAAALSSLFACTIVGNTLSGDKIDYRSGGEKTAGLDVPPDLTQLTRDSRYQQTQGAAVSAASYQAGAAAASPAAAASAPITIAPQAIGEMRIERLGNERWLRTSLTPEQLWPQLQAFWKERGFRLATDEPSAGVMETDWAENRAKLPQDFIRSSIGKVLDGLYSTGERDRFRTRLERNASGGTEIYISHRGLVETVISLSGTKTGTGDGTVWQPRPADPELEAEFLRRLMVKLGVSQEQSKALVASGTTKPTSRLATVAGAPVIQIDEGFDRAWRRVGLSLDRTGFTVEDRDRTQGTYFVRYVESTADKKEPGFLGKLFSGSTPTAPPLKYRILLKSQGEATTVSVLNAQGVAEPSANAQRIVQVIVDDLK